MNHYTSKVNTILIELTDAIGFQEEIPQHIDAFRIAERRLVELIYETNNITDAINKTI